MLAAMGVEAFAERARRELLATGETVRKRTVETRDELTAQEALIARLARDGLSNPEIGTRLFISPRTVKYHLRKVFIKLDISSRNELDRVLPSDPTTVLPLLASLAARVGALPGHDWPLALCTGGCQRGPGGRHSAAMPRRATRTVHWRMRARSARMTLAGVHWSDTPIETRFRTIDGLSIRFAESEDRDDHALLLSPWPESLLAFEPTWARLAEHTHLVAIDLPGLRSFPASRCAAVAAGDGRVRHSRSPTRSGSRTRTSSAPTSAPGPRSSPRPCIRDGCAASSSEAEARRFRSSWAGC